MTGALLVAVYLVILVGFLGLDVIAKVGPTARPALLAVVGAVGGMVLVAAVVLPFGASSGTPAALTAIAAALGAAALVGGFVSAWRALQERRR